MADKGFQIWEDLLVRKAELHIPPGRCGSEQMSKNDVKKTQDTTNRRIYVEMAIRRLKSFRILKHEIPLTLISQIDKIICICAALCNLYPQLSKKNNILQQYLTTLIVNFDVIFPLQVLLIKM